MAPTIAVPYSSGGLRLDLSGHSELVAEGTPIGSALAAASFDYETFQDDFHGDQKKDEYPAAITNGTAAAVTFTANLGHLLLVSGTDDNGYGGQALSLGWNGDRGFLYEAMFETPAAITSLKFEFGVVDAVAALAGAVNAKATPTLNVADTCAVVIFDTDDDTNLACISSKGGAAVATQDLAAGLPGGAIAAATKYMVAIRGSGDNVEFFFAKAGLPLKRIAAHMNNAGIEGGTGVSPWGFCQARAGAASRTMIWQGYRMIRPRF